MLTLALIVALGPKPGDVMYIKSAYCEMIQQPNGRGKRTAVPQGTAVKWLGPAAGNKAIHQIEWSGQRGYVPSLSLTTDPPASTPTEPEAKPEVATDASAEQPGKAPAAAGPADEATARTALRALTVRTQAQRARLAAHAKAAGLVEAK